MSRIERFFPSTEVKDWSSGAFGGGGSPPGAPGTLSLADGSSDPITEIDLSWSAGLSGSQVISGYHIQKSTNGSSWTDVVADTGSAATTYTATGLSENTQYWFRVAAINSVGEGDYGNEPNHTTRVPVEYTTTGSPTTRTYTSGGINYKSLHWTGSGTFVPSYIVPGKTFDVWVVSGGGGGGIPGWHTNYRAGAGGGGAGGAKSWTSQTLGTASHTVTVGGGGAGAVQGGNQYYGTVSSFGGVSSFAINGGSTLSTTRGGRVYSNVGDGYAGGSGGGAGGYNNTYTGGAGTAGEGNDGGDGGGNHGGAGGGGGKGGAGSNGGSGLTGAGGDGGAAGTNDYADGTTSGVGVGVWAGGGGAGAGASATSGGGSGGSGGGDGGNNASPDATSGAANSGGGGGGCGWNSTQGTAGSGGGGAVVIRWEV